jgi:hypothetical protein
MRMAARYEASLVNPMVAVTLEWVITRARVPSIHVYTGAASTDMLLYRRAQFFQLKSTSDCSFGFLTGACQSLYRLSLSL